MNKLDLIQTEIKPVFADNLTAKDVKHTPCLEHTTFNLEAIQLPHCPFCGGKSVVKQTHVYTVLAFYAECTRCHIRTSPQQVWPTVLDVVQGKTPTEAAILQQTVDLWRSRI